jgi:hypothetical protein
MLCYGFSSCYSCLCFFAHVVATASCVVVAAIIAFTTALVTPACYASALRDVARVGDFLFVVLMHHDAMLLLLQLLSLVLLMLLLVMLRL